MNRHNKLNLLVASVIGASAALAQAQDTQQDGLNRAKPSRGIEEVLVTALRRETSLATTPHSISALSENTLKRQGVNDMADLVRAVPGLTLKDQGPGQSRPVIRGIQGNGEGQVGVYYDDTPITGGPGTTNDAGRFSPELKPIDIERVEVLRGPQGTLYGGGSMGGTIRFIANKPDAEAFEANISAEYSSVDGGGNGHQVSGMVNIPLIQDQLALRAVLYTRDAEGFIDNVTLGKKDINDFSSDGGRISLRWTPSDDLTVTGTWYYQEMQLDAGYHIKRNLDGMQTDLAALDPFEDETDIYNLTVDYSTEWADIVYSYSQYERDATYRYWTPALPPSFPNGGILQQPQPVETDTHELRFSSNADGVFQWTFGIYSQERDSYVESQGWDVVAGTGEIDPTLGPFFQRWVESNLEQKAVFGEVAYDFTNELTLTVGARYFEIDGYHDARQLVTFFYSPLPNEPVLRTEGTEEDTVVKVHLAYDFSEDLVGYAQFSQGYRPGGPNQDVGGQATIPQSYLFDSVDNYEIGVRGSFFDNVVTAGAALYYIEWQDMQLLQSDPTGLFRYIGNGGEAEIRGIEVEITAAPLDDLIISAGFNYVDAELSGDSPFDDQDGLSKTGLKGDPIPNTPDWTANLSVEYGWNVGDYRAFLFGSYQYTDESVSDFNEYLIDVNTGRTSDTSNIEWDDRQGDYGIANIRLGLEANSWDIALFANNVFNEEAIVQIFEDSLRPNPGFNFVEKPRTIGISFSKHF